MRHLESVVVRQLLQTINPENFPKYCINIGAGDVTSLRKTKPWVHANVFDILTQGGCSVLHTDLFEFANIDKQIDLSQSTCLEFTKTLPSNRIFLCTNVLEHLTQKTRANAVEVITQALLPGDFLLISVPYRYPYHPDPIDTMFRPAPEELQALFDLQWLNTSVIEAGSFAEDLKGMAPLKRMRKLAKPLWPLQTPENYRSNIHRLLYIFKPYQISLVFGKKIRS